MLRPRRFIFSKINLWIMGFIPGSSKQTVVLSSKGKACKVFDLFIIYFIIQKLRTNYLRMLSGFMEPLCCP